MKDDRRSGGNFEAKTAFAQTSINFAAHQTRRGHAGAPEDFQEMIAGLRKAGHPDARMIAANPGDWGIDVLVGNFSDGSVEVLQSKYFFPKVVKNHQQQIRDSFKRACDKADSLGFLIKRWVLCVPASMDGPTVRWWDGWKKRVESESKHDLVIELWDETTLRHKLIAPEAESVRSHYYGLTVFPSPPVTATVEEVEDYLRRFTSFVRKGLHELVPLTVRIEDESKSIRSARLSQLLEAGRHAQLIGPSGCGKTHMVSHAAVELAASGWLPILAGGMFYEDHLSRLLDEAVAAHSTRTAVELMHGAQQLDMPAIVILDGHNECPERLRERLLQELSALCLRSPVTVLLTGQTPLAVPETLSGTCMRIESPDEDERQAILTSYGAPDIAELYDPFTTALELSLAAKLAGHLPQPTGRAQLLDAFIRECLSGTAHPAGVREVLRHLALLMDGQLTVSLPVGEAERAPARLPVGQGISPAVMDEVFACAVIDVQHGRLSFSHELYGRFLTAEALLLTCGDGERLVRELARPRHRDLAVLVLPLECRSDRVLTLLTGIHDTQVWTESLRGRLGPIVERVARAEALRLLTEETQAMRDARVSCGPAFGEATVLKGRQRSDHEEAVFAAVGEVLHDGQFLPEVVSLLAETDAACQRGTEAQSDTPATSPSDIVAALLLSSRPATGEWLAVSAILNACESVAPMRSLRERTPVPPSTLVRLVGKTRPGRYGLLHLICLLLQGIDSAEVARLVPRVVELCWATDAYHLQLEALYLAQSIRQVVEDDTRAQLTDLLEGLQTHNLMLSGALVEALDSYGLIKLPMTAEDVAEQIARLLEQPSDPVARQVAYRVITNQLEDVISEPHFTAIERLAPEQRTALLTMAALGGDSFFAYWILRQLLEVANPMSLSAFEHWAIRIDDSSSSRQEAVGCHVLGIKGCSLLRDSLPQLADHPGSDGEAWRCYGKIIYWMHRPGLSDVEIQARCEPLWKRLECELLPAAVDPLYCLADSRWFFDDKSESTYQQILQLFPKQLCKVLEYGLANEESLTSLFPSHHHFGGERAQYIVKTLGTVGNADTIDRLTRHSDDPMLGSSAVTAIRHLKDELAL